MRRWWALGLMVVLMLAGAAPRAVAQGTGSSSIVGLPLQGFDAAAAPAGQFIFTNAADWTRFWGRYSTQPAPLVDFARWQVVAVLLGQRPNAGYAVQVISASVQGGNLLVRPHEWTPAPGTVAAQVLTYPADIAAVPAGRPVRFSRTSGPRALLAPALRDVPYRTLEASELSAQVPEQFAVFTTAASWQQFWTRYGRGAAPEVDFARGYMVAGVAGLRSRSGVTISQVQRMGDRTFVTLGPGGTACSAPAQRSLFLVVVQSPRVDFILQPFCR